MNRSIILAILVLFTASIPAQEKPKDTGKLLRSVLIARFENAKQEVVNWTASMEEAKRQVAIWTGKAEAYQEMLRDTSLAIMDTTPSIRFQPAKPDTVKKK